MNWFLSCLILVNLPGLIYGFFCYTCNNRPGEDDTQECKDRLEECQPGITSCSSVVFKSRNGKTHFRKFCTAPGTPIYQYLLFFPGSALCQNIETTDVVAPPAMPIIDSNGTVHHPPAPPSRQTSNLLCVCTKPRCNQGTWREVLDRTMLQNFEVEPTKKKIESPSFVKKSEFNM